MRELLLSCRLFLKTADVASPVDEDALETLDRLKGADAAKGSVVADEGDVGDEADRMGADDGAVTAASAMCRG